MLSGVWSCGSRRRKNRRWCVIIWVKAIIIGVRGRGVEVTIRKVIFIKDNMTRDDDTLRLKVETFMTLVIRGRTEVNASSRTRREFVDGCGQKIWITEATKDV